MFKNVASQKIQVFAFDATTNVPKTGDAANITVYVSKDHGAVTALGDTSATEMDATNAAGDYVFDLTQAETNADELAFSGKSSTANIKIVPRFISTFPASFTSSVAQTGDSFARLGAPVGASISADIAEIEAETDALIAGVNVTSLNGDSTSAANIAKTTRAIGRGTASGVPTTTSIPTSACTPAGAAADQFKGRIITFDADTTTTALRGQATDITASSNSATPTMTVTALTTAPVSGDTFSIT